MLAERGNVVWETLEIIRCKVPSRKAQQGIRTSTIVTHILKGISAPGKPERSQKPWLYGISISP